MLRLASSICLFSASAFIFLNASFSLSISSFSFSSFFFSSSAFFLYASSFFSSISYSSLLFLASSNFRWASSCSLLTLAFKAAIFCFSSWAFFYSASISILSLISCSYLDFFKFSISSLYCCFFLPSNFNYSCSHYFYCANCAESSGFDGSSGGVSDILTGLKESPSLMELIWFWGIENLLLGKSEYLGSGSKLGRFKSMRFILGESLSLGGDLLLSAVFVIWYLRL